MFIAHHQQQTISLRRSDMFDLALARLGIVRLTQSHRDYMSLLRSESFSKVGAINISLLRSDDACARCCVTTKSEVAGITPRCYSKNSKTYSSLNSIWYLRSSVRYSFLNDFR